MALETGTYINSLNAANPASTDGLSQADDHLRLIKSTIKSTFANIDAAVTATEDDLNILTGASAAGVTAAELQHLDGVTSAIQTQLNTLTSSVSAAVPSGVIMMWSGAASAIPSGFVLCNGSNSTPDLRGRFIIGAHGDTDSDANTYDVGDTGGSATHTLTTAEMPSHTHTATSTVTDPGHDHYGLYYSYGEGGNEGGATTGNDSISNSNNSQNLGTTTDTTGITVATTIASTGDGGAHENRPPYYALCYIMKT